MRAKATQTASEIEDWVAIYSTWANLLNAEAVILDRMKRQLPAIRMLDIGIGGGRTTVHFAGAAREYVGIDFDRKMIEACERRFADRGPSVSFLVCDARSMGMFDDSSFDFILFSFNGIDYLSHEDRLKTLREVWRVGRHGQYFVFSSHNLNAVERLIVSPRRLLSRLVRRRLSLGRLWRLTVLRFRNEPIGRLRGQEHAFVYDGVYSHKVSWLLHSLWKGLGRFYYIKPEAQIRQLREAGYEVTDVYSEEGETLTTDQLGANTDYWLYYFCRIVKA